MNKILIKLGWPGALILLVGFLTITIYLVVDRATSEKEKYLEDSLVEKPKLNTTDENPSDNQNLENESSEESSLSKSEVNTSLTGNLGTSKPETKVKEEPETEEKAETEIEEKVELKATNQSLEDSKEFNKDDNHVIQGATISEAKDADIDANPDGILERSDDDESQDKTKTQVDILRIDESGIAVIAGKADPDTTVKAKIGSKVIGSSEANKDGDFVILGEVPASKDAQELVLITRVERKKEEVDTEPDWVLSSNSFIILPGLVQNLSEEIVDEQEINIPSVIEVKEDDLIVKQNQSPIRVEKVSLDQIKYSSDGVAILFGRCRSDMSIFVYLDNVLRTKVKPSSDGSWRVDLGVVVPGVYTLRLDEVNNKGVVSSRIESPFKQETKDLLEKLFEDSITVQPGNSLWRIARRVYGQGILYVEIYKKNSHLIKNPSLIYPGQVFLLLD